MQQVPPWDSLPLVLRAVALHVGRDLNTDDLSAALGLTIAVTAVPSERDLSTWCLYARDAFLPQTALLFGLDLREIHPPEAAVGLAGFTEFDQHFDASYRPLIRNALQNSQPVIAWRGWSAGRDGSWGTIRAETQAGVGFEGVIVEQRGPGGETYEVASILERPPIQVYVVERIAQHAPDESAIVQAALHHSMRWLSGDVSSRFDILTGPRAYDAWIERIQAEPTDDPHSRELPRESRALATALAECHAVGVRFWHHRAISAAPALRGMLDGLAEACEDVLASMRAASATVERSAFVAHLLNARAATLKAETALRIATRATNAA